MILDQDGNPIQSPADRESAAYTMVREFRQAFDASKDPALWAKLIREELAEFDEALQNLVKEFSDVKYVLAGALQTYEEVGGPDLDETLAKRIEIASAIVSSFLPELVEDTAFAEVHRSNMSKLGPDGKPVRREDGKILKGPNYSPADLTFITTNV